MLAKRSLVGKNSQFQIVFALSFRAEPLSSKLEVSRLLSFFLDDVYGLVTSRAWLFLGFFKI
jgi:hypothetical protein